MMKPLLRYWYRITGQKAAMEYTRKWMTIFGLLDSSFDYQTQWQRDWGHIAKVYEE